MLFPIQTLRVTAVRVRTAGTLRPTRFAAGHRGRPGPGVAPVRPGARLASDADHGRRPFKESLLAACDDGAHPQERGAGHRGLGGVATEQCGY